MKADVARLRFSTEMDSAGLKTGCKESSAALKSLDRETSGFSPSWRGIKESGHKLKFITSELAGKEGLGGLHKAMGIAAAGASFGVAGAGVAAVSVGIGMLQDYWAEQQKEQQRAANTLRGAHKAGLGGDTYRTLENIAGEDKAALDDLAWAMKRLADEGPRASDNLKNVAADVGALANKGLKVNGQEPDLAKQAAFARFDKLSWAERNAVLRGQFEGAPEQHTNLGLMTDMKEGTRPNVLAYEKIMRQREESALDRVTAEREAERYRAPQDKLRESLRHIANFRDKGYWSDDVAGRAQKEAMAEFGKSASPGSWAAASQYGSVGAYSMIANAQLGATAQDEANKLLEEIVAELRVANKKPARRVQTAEATQ